MISAVIFAAGKAIKTGEQEAPATPRGEPALERVIESALASKVGEVVCVVSDFESARRQVGVQDERLIWLVNYGADGGPNGSMIGGLWAIDPKSDGVLFLPRDQSFIRRDLIDALIERFEQGHALIVAPSFQGRPGNPLLFRRELFPELLALSGGRGVRGLLERNRDKTELISWTNEILVVDADPRTDHDRL